MTTESISILSLIVAALAVFVGPVISWNVARRQIAASLEVSNKQITAPMRQAWINNLRDILSELLSSALHYHVSGFEDRTDQEYKNLTHLEYKLVLMLNPYEDDHQKLEKLISQMTGMLSGKGSSALDSKFEACHRAVVELSRDVLKREWNRIRDRIKPS